MTPEELHRIAVSDAIRALLEEYEIHGDKAYLGLIGKAIELEVLRL